MDIFGIGPLEIVAIFLIMLIVLGPQDMVNTGRTIGRYLRKIMLSPTWKTVQETSRRIRYLPNTLIRQAGIEEFQQEIERDMDLPSIAGFTEISKEDFSLDAWTRPPEKDTARDQGETSLESSDASEENDEQALS